MITATRTPATECADGSIEFVVRVPSRHAGELLETWPVGVPHLIGSVADVVRDRDPPVETVASDKPKPPTQTIEGAGGLDLSDFGSFSQSDGAREVFRARHMELISNGDFQQHALGQTQGPIDQFHSPRQIAQAYLVKSIKSLTGNPDRMRQEFNALYDTWCGKAVTLDIQE